MTETLRVPSERLRRISGEFSVGSRVMHVTDIIYMRRNRGVHFK